MERALEKELLTWKESKNRFPLLLRGARQVGKTYLIEKLGTTAFSSFVSVNFEAQPEAIACFASLDPQEILIRLQAMTGQTIRQGETLLFLDEIQACPQAILALRYFKEKVPGLHVIGAGSLLEFALAEKSFSFPVGRVQFLYLRPLSFAEFALVRGKEGEWAELQACSLEKPPSEALHHSMSRLVREYAIVGGMPAAVAAYREHLALQEASLIHNILLSTYKADFAKYATVAEQQYLKTLFSGMFQTLGEQFKYAKIDPDIRSRELKQALLHLEWAGLIKPIYASSASGIPLAAEIKHSKFKLSFLDIGLVRQALQIDPKEIFDEEIILVNRGALAEQLVAQELLAYTSPFEEGGLFYWQRERQGSDAEIDYLITFDRYILPIEVKAGAYGKLKSLYQFIEEKKSPFGIRISQNPLSFDSGVLSVPFYLISRLKDFIGQVPVW